MFDSWTFGRRLAAGFALAGMTLVVIASVSYRTTEDLIEDSDAVTHSYDVKTRLSDFTLELVNAETGQRGFVLTGVDSYLQPYEQALSNLKTIYETLHDLTGNDPAQQHRLDEISPLMNEKLAELADTISLRRTQGFDAALKEVLTDKGKIAMDHMRAILAEMNQAENALLKERAKQDEASAELAKSIILFGGILGSVVVAIAGWFITVSLIRQVGSAASQVQSSSAELQAAANQQASGAKEQATAMSEISTTITELLATSRQIAESAQRVAQIASQTANAARAGHGTVETTHESITAIRQQVDQIVARMLELGKKSQEIGAVLEIVAELAEQTNILAINATIEAAGAGETGRRFSVVADEIRKLADRVGGSAKEIRTLIDDVRGAVNSTVMATETGSKAVDAGSRQFGEVASSLQGIVGLVTTTTEAAREIELSTKQQSTAVEQVKIAIANVAQASKETEASSGQTLLTSTQLAHLSNDLLRIIRPQAA